MSSGNPINGAPMLPALASYENLLERWTMLRTTEGPAIAECDVELTIRARSAWNHSFSITAVLSARMELAQQEAERGHTCCCGGSGFQPLWAAEAYERGLRPESYASAFGWRPVLCLLCRRGTEVTLDSNGVPEGVPCSVCHGDGITPAWVGGVLGGSPSALDREQTATGWFPCPCRTCGGFGRVLSVTVETSAIDVSESDAIDAQAVLEAAVEKEATEVRVDTIDTQAASDTVAEAGSSLPMLVREGDVWRATYRGRTAFLRHRLGLTYVAYLLDHPDQRVDLAMLIALRGLPSANIDAGIATSNELEVITTSDLGPRIDQHALDQYRARFADLGSELDRAERNNDLGTVTRLRHEQEFLKREILGATASNGRLRSQQVEQTRARHSVQKAIADAIQEMEKHFPGFAAHLREAITCGHHPMYRPPRLESRELTPGTGCREIAPRAREL